MRTRVVLKTILGGYAVMATTFGVGTVALAEEDRIVQTCNNRNREHLMVVQRADGTFNYLAQRFNERHCLPFTECEATTSYQTSGTVDYSRSGFHNDDVHSQFLCSAQILFSDHRDGTVFVFAEDECTYSPVQGDPL